jgi:putative transcriptional regulator
MRNRLKVCRAMYDMTQEELAKKVGVTRQTIISIEAGRYSPSLELAFRLAKIFNTTIEDVFLFEEDHSQASTLTST